MVIIKKQKITRIGTDVDKIKALCAADENVKWWCHYGKYNSMAVPQIN